MRVVQPGANREEDRARHIGSEAAGVEATPNSAAGEPLHHEQAQALVVDEVVDRDDVRMVQRREHPRLGEESRAHRRVGAERAREVA